jgi:adenylate cyclase
MQRRLAAILLIDMVGYSRLMGLDEEGTIARQQEHRDKIIDPIISAHGGRLVKTTGDGLLVEFPSVVDAVKCAVEMQTELVDLETDVRDDQRVHYRIGIMCGRRPDCKEKFDVVRSVGCKSCVRPFRAAHMPLALM